MLRTTFDAGERRSGANKRATERFLIVSGHDFRTPRRANMHFIARELVKRGTMQFFSLGCSPLSRLTGDPRLPILSRANTIEEFDGVQCYLWKSAWHPVNLEFAALSGLSRALFSAYRRNAPAVFRNWVESSDVIIVESGMAPIFLETIQALNPNARKIYLASDLLDTIGVDPFVAAELDAHVDAFDTVVVPSRLMAPAFPSRATLAFVPHGLDIDASSVGGSPYAEGIHAVSVGSMLFDRRFFELVAPQFPEVTFHVIGGGREAETLTHLNIRRYGEMPFAETLAYIKHAHFGIAPYKAASVQPYLCDTSMKLMQYGFFGISAVCPAPAVGDHAGRFGYLPNTESIAQAVRGALAAGKMTPPQMLSWSAVTDRILHPQGYPDTRVAQPVSAPG